MKPFPTGKLPTDVLRELLKRHEPHDSRLLVGPGIGVDAAVIDMGDRVLVAKTDPVTFATDDIGWYAVHVNANDVACCGATPKWFLATLLLPEQSTTTHLVESVFAQLAEACEQLGVSLCGGHTEITYNLDRPIVVGQMLGEAPADRYVTVRGAKVGDALLLTKGLAIEGTAIIAREKRAELNRVLSKAGLKRAAQLLRSPGISVVRDAAIALDGVGVHALHDPTEGGIAGGLFELAEAAQVGILVYESQLPVLPECRAICRHFQLNPLGLIASGALLISVDRHYAEETIERLSTNGIAATRIGEIVHREHGCLLQSADGRQHCLPNFARDEIARLFSPGD